MAEPLKRGLRERQRKRNLDSDVSVFLSKKEEGDHFSYVKSYPKVHPLLTLGVRQPLAAAQPGCQAPHQILQHCQ
jgi:hypothetical protein